MKKLLALTAALAALFVARVSAAENLDLKYFTVDTKATVVQDITYGKGGTVASTDTIPSPGDLPMPPSWPVIDPTASPSNPLDGVNNTLDALDRVVNLVDKVFDLIAKNQPVVNIAVNYANAVPFGTSHWTQLQGWSQPATKKYAFVMKNLYGSEVVKVVYQVHWTHSGNFQGVGKFLTGVTVEPLSVTTAWGYNVDLTAEVPDSTIANVGTTAKPVASMQLQLKWKVHTIIKDIQEKVIYYVQGDGYMKQIASPFSQGVSVGPKQAQMDQRSVDAFTEKFGNVRFN